MQSRRLLTTTRLRGSRGDNGHIARIGEAMEATLTRQVAEKLSMESFALSDDAAVTCILLTHLDRQARLSDRSRRGRWRDRLRERKPATDAEMKSLPILLGPGRLLQPGA